MIALNIVGSGRINDDGIVVGMKSAEVPSDVFVRAMDWLVEFMGKHQEAPLPSDMQSEYPNDEICILWHGKDARELERLYPKEFLGVWGCGSYQVLAGGVPRQ